MGHNSKIKIGKYYPFIRFKKHIFTKTAIFPPYACCKLIISQDLNDLEQCFWEFFGEIFVAQTQNPNHLLE